MIPFSELRSCSLRGWCEGMSAPSLAYCSKLIIEHIDGFFSTEKNCCVIFFKKDSHPVLEMRQKQLLEKVHHKHDLEI